MKFSDCACPTCEEVFLYYFKQHAHAEKTGHEIAQRCRTSSPYQGHKRCERQNGHPGSHGYVADRPKSFERTVYWDFKE